MKQRKINLKFLAAIGIAFAILFGFIFAGGGYLFCGKNVEDNVSSVNNSASVSAAITPAATNSRYGTFAHGANYSYTAYFTTFKPDTRQYTTYDSLYSSFSLKTWSSTKGTDTAPVSANCS